MIAGAILVAGLALLTEGVLVVLSVGGHPRARAGSPFRRRRLRTGRAGGADHGRRAAVSRAEPRR